MIIYKAENKINGKVYIGKTKGILIKRQWGHFNNARKGVKTVFCHAIRKYGEDNFEFSVIEYCSSKYDLNERERFHIKQNDCVIPNGYNMTIGGDGNDGSIKPNLGKKLSEKIKNKIRESLKGRKDSDEIKERKSKSLKKAYSEGRKKPWNKGLTKETNDSVKSHSEKVKGNPAWNKGLKGFLKGREAWNTGLTKENHPSLLSASEKKKGNPAWNKGLTKETDQRVALYAESLKNSEAVGVWKKGHIPWNKGLSIPQTEESNIKRSKTMKGKPKSEETRLRMVEAQRLRRSQERQVSYAELSRSNSIQFP